MVSSCILILATFSLNVFIVSFYQKIRISEKELTQRLIEHINLMLSKQSLSKQCHISNAQ